MIFVNKLFFEKELNLNLEVVKNVIYQSRNLRIAKVLFNHHTPDKLIETVVNQGFTPLVVAGDIDVHMAVEAMELLYNLNIDIIALMTRYADFLPIINKSKEYGKETIVNCIEPGFSIALKNSSDQAIILSAERNIVDQIF